MELDQQLVTHAMKVKLGLLRSVVERLPEPLQGTVKEVETVVLRSLHEVTGEFAQGGLSPESAQSDGLKSIHVD